MKNTRAVSFFPTTLPFKRQILPGSPGECRTPKDSSGIRGVLPWVNLFNVPVFHMVIVIPPENERLEPENTRYKPPIFGFHVGFLGRVHHCSVVRTKLC